MSSIRGLPTSSLDASHTTKHRVKKHPDSPDGQLCFNCWVRTSTISGRSSRLLIISQTCSICLAKEVHVSYSAFKNRPWNCKRNGSKTILRMLFTYRCTVRGPLMTPRKVRLSKEMTPQSITPG
ncbi:hypothetical protein TNCV_1943301 [Trichonephila clavipes]|nr:hypothetical protein TNCV_1943301 [Trichonephila clavipes]